jgi:hypothetical protein
MTHQSLKAVGIRALCAATLILVSGAAADPLTSPSQLSPGNGLITFEAQPLGPIGVVATIQCVAFSSPSGMSILDIGTQPYSGPLLSGHVLHPLPGAVGSGLYLNTAISFDPPVSEVGLSWWDPTSPGNVLRVYDVNLQFLEEIIVPQQPPGGTGASFVGIRRATREIAYAFCYPGNSGDTYAIDNVSYGPFCYANCDCSTTPPALNANDFQCFLNEFASGDPRANCDGSTQPPILNANDFQCFLNAYATGCS